MVSATVAAIDLLLLLQAYFQGSALYVFWRHSKFFLFYAFKTNRTIHLFLIRPLLLSITFQFFHIQLFLIFFNIISMIIKLQYFIRPYHHIGTFYFSPHHAKNSWFNFSTPAILSSAGQRACLTWNSHSPPSTSTHVQTGVDGHPCISRLQSLQLGHQPIKIFLSQQNIAKLNENEIQRSLRESFCTGTWTKSCSLRISWF